MKRMLSLEIKKRSRDDLCRSMLERQAAVISVQKPDVALKKLKIIISSALKLSNKKGFQAMSLRDLSKESGVSMGGLYAYFDSKTTLLNMILTEVTDAVETVLGDPPDIVAAEIQEHKMLRQLLLILQQFYLKCPILFGGSTPRTGSCNGPDRDLTPEHPDEDFRAGTDHLKSAKIEVEHEGGRVRASKGAIKREGRLAKTLAPALGRHDLKDVAGLDVVLGCGPLDKRFSLRSVFCACRHSHRPSPQPVCTDRVSGIGRLRMKRRRQITRRGRLVQTSRAGRRRRA